MSGFVGFIQRKQNEDKAAVLAAMLDNVRHRGPQHRTQYIDEHAALGLQSTEELRAAGVAMPLANADGSVALAYDGYFVRMDELRRDLQEKGHMFRSDAVQEVLLKGYEQYGIDIVRHIHGAFAIAIWDRAQDTLFLARDPFGTKPLYYSTHTRDAAFLFGSEIKGLLPYHSFQKELNERALKPYLTFQYSVLDETFFKGVYKLRPGYYLRYSNGEAETTPYWDATAFFQEGDADIEYYKQQINTIMREAVSEHQQSTASVGAFLSGGIDSSYVTALAKPAQTFSVGFQDYEELFNETDLAQDLSRMLGIANDTRIVSAEECFAALSTIQYHMDEPQSNPSSVPLYFLAERARAQVSVVLSGEGADELFGGYIWYQDSPKVRAYKKIPQPLRRALYKLARELPSNRITDFLVKGGEKVEERFIGQAKIFTEDEAIQLLQGNYRDGPSVQEITQEHYARVAHLDDVSKMQYLDLQLWQPGDILQKADKMTAAHGLDVRVPFLDERVLAIAASLPRTYRVHATNTKYALRLASADVLPTAWAQRTKLGFPVPIRHWLREEKYYHLVQETFRSEYAQQFFDRELLLKLLEDHFNGKQNNARKIWTVYVFLVWYERFFIDYAPQQ